MLELRTAYSRSFCGSRDEIIFIETALLEKHRKKSHPRLAHGSSAHYFRVMKNITLSADGRTIELAREEARSRKTTLNALFREWIEDLAARDERRKNIKNIFDELDSHITRIPKLTRDQMNER